MLDHVYVVSPLPVGDYKIEARKEGFKSLAREGIRIDVNSAPTLDLELGVAIYTGERRGELKGEGEWWPVAEIEAAGLPTLFVKAARLTQQD